MTRQSKTERQFVAAVERELRVVCLNDRALCGCCTCSDPDLLRRYQETRNSTAGAMIEGSAPRPIT